MVDPIAVERRRANRFRFIRALYEETDGSTVVPVDSSALAADLAIDEADADAIVTYLSNEGLLRVVGVSGLSSAIMLTHQGLVEFEESYQKPGQPTQHFPAWQQVINIHGDVTESQIGQAGHDVAQPGGEPD